MNFTQLTIEVMHSSSGTWCLDDVYPNQPQRIAAVETHDIGLADHLPVFCVCLYHKEMFHSNCH